MSAMVMVMNNAYDHPTLTEKLGDVHIGHFSCVVLENSECFKLSDIEILIGMDDLYKKGEWLYCQYPHREEYRITNFPESQDCDIPKPHRISSKCNN